MATTQIDLTKFTRYDEAFIKASFSVAIPPHIVVLLFSYRDDIQELVDNITDDDFPKWFFNSVDNIVRGFQQIVEMPTKDAATTDKFMAAVQAFNAPLYYGLNNDTSPKIQCSLPILANFAKTHNLEKKTNIDPKVIRQDLLADVEQFKKNYEDFRTSADSTLTALNKEAGKIGVKQYAEIFDNQAKEHSKSSKEGLGRAQWWLISAGALFAILVVLFMFLDSIFSIKGAATFTPEVFVHVAGRFLLVSLIIFLVSFSFKQFRINMHLYTLNKHRANTLKSFEYLTLAPDKLDPGTYNAILMEVAKAIYEAGQTGYIGVNDGQADMPSIIDLSKVITQPRTP